MFKILIITDTKLSSLNQCNSIVSELKSSKIIEIKYIKIYKSFFHLFPNSIIYFKLLLDYFFGFRFHNERVDFVISCGRITAPYSLILKKIYKCKNCHILNPYIKKKVFDKIIIPEYDSPKFSFIENLILTKGTLVNIEKISLKKKKLKCLIKLFNGKKKIVLILVGGDGKSSKITFKELQPIIESLNQQKNIEIAYCFSRRTSHSLKKLIVKNKNEKSLIFPLKSFNPYWELINISNFIFVTADSVSMTSDALSSGKPTYVIPIKRIKSKIKKFHFNLNKENFTRVYKNKLQKWKYEKFEESKKVGKELKRYLNI